MKKSDMTKLVAALAMVLVGGWFSVGQALAKEKVNRMRIKVTVKNTTGKTIKIKKLYFVVKNPRFQGKNVKLRKKAKNIKNGGSYTKAKDAGEQHVHIGRAKIRFRYRCLGQSHDAKVNSRYYRTDDGSFIVECTVKACSGTDSKRASCIMK